MTITWGDGDKKQNANVDHIDAEGWPTRSADLIPLDFNFWGYLKSKVYSTPIDTRSQLLQRVEDRCNELKENDQMTGITFN